VPRFVFVLVPGPTREDVAGGWRRLHNEELRKLYPSPNIIRVIKSRRIAWGACSTHGRDKKYIKYFAWKT
jgi:hypothetical protein